MPQVDLETLVTACAGGGNDRKIACETLADDDPPTTDEETAAEVPPDLPPESFWLSKDAEYDWFDRNALYERNESTKGFSNSNQNNNHNSNSNSQRLSVSLKSKASMIGVSLHVNEDTKKIHPIKSKDTADDKAENKAYDKAEDN